MEDAMKPSENQDPLNKQNPLDDSLLDSLEHSIENPLGFTDPLAEQDKQLMDDLARQLDAVESSIESSSPLPPAPQTANGDETAASEEIPPAECYEHSEVAEEIEDESDGSLPSDLQDSPIDNADIRPRLPEVPGRRAGNVRGRRGFPLRRRFVRIIGKTRARKSGHFRFCPESHEVIDREKCESCEKYRRWPQGTDEEPRECWHDWQAEQPSDESDEEDDDEEGF